MKRLWLVFSLFLASAALAAPETRTVDLHHLPAAQLTERLRPLAGQATVIPAGDVLILRGESAELDELTKLIRHLDTAPRQLRLSVRQVGETSRTDEGIHVGTEARIYGNRTRESPNLTQTLEVMEGHWARIDAGRSVPLKSETLILGPRGTTIRRGTEYQDVGSGFEVRPQLVGTTVHLEVRAYRGDWRGDPRGAVETQEIISTIEGPLGQWLKLGEHHADTSEDHRGLVYAQRSRTVEARQVEIKVERVP